MESDDNSPGPESASHAGLEQGSTPNERLLSTPFWSTHIGAVLALVGVVVAAVIAAAMSYVGVQASKWQAERSVHQQYQSDLVLRALEPDDPEEREDLLRFLLDSRLLTDGEIREGITLYLEGSEQLPQFGGSACHA